MSSCVCVPPDQKEPVEVTTVALEEDRLGALDLRRGAQLLEVAIDDAEQLGREPLATWYRTIPTEHDHIALCHTTLP